MNDGNAFAEAKKKENIIEYVLLVWQMEDLVRATKFDLEALKAFVFSGDESEEETQVYFEWLKSIHQSMKSRQIEKKGHIYELDEIMAELSLLHNSLQGIFNDTKYIESHKIAAPNIAAFKVKSSESFSSDIEVCITALYGLLSLRMKKAEISEETQGAMQTFSNMLGLLADRYNKMKKGELQPGLN